MVKMHVRRPSISSSFNKAIVIEANNTSLTNVSEQVLCYGVYAALGKNQVAAVNTNTQNVKQPKKSTHVMFR